MNDEEKCVGVEIILHDDTGVDVHIYEVVTINSCGVNTHIFPEKGRRKAHNLQTTHQLPKYLRGQMAVIDMGISTGSLLRELDEIGYMYRVPKTYVRELNGDVGGADVYRIYSVPEGKIKELLHE